MTITPGEHKERTDAQPGANLGFARLRWADPGAARAFAVLFAPPRCDFVATLMQSLETLGLAVTDARSWGPQAVADAATGETLTSGASSASIRILIAEQTKANFDAVLAARPQQPWIACFDDACASALSAETHKCDARASLAREAENQLQSIKAMDRHGGDLMIASLRKMREFPEQHLRAVMHFLGSEPQADTLRKAQATLRRDDDPYALSIRTQMRQAAVFQGMVNRICKNGVVAGWVKDALEDRRIAVRVLVDGEEVAEEAADYLREDLKKLELGDAAYGFAIDISRFLDDEPKLVEVRTVETDSLIGTLEMTLRRGLRLDDKD